MGGSPPYSRLSKTLPSSHPSSCFLYFLGGRGKGGDVRIRTVYYGFGIPGNKERGNNLLSPQHNYQKPKQKPSLPSTKTFEKTGLLSLIPPPLVREFIPDTIKPVGLWLKRAPWGGGDLCLSFEKKKEPSPLFLSPFIRRETALYSENLKKEKTHAPRSFAYMCKKVFF